MVYRAQLCLVALGLCLLAQDRVQALPLEEDYALEFDGVTDFVALAPTASMMDSHWQDEKTVSLWVRPMGDSRTCVDVAREWGIRRIVARPRLAYGNSARSGIPANSTLVFDVQLLDVR